MKKMFILSIAFIPTFVFAQGFQVNLQGQKQQGMGGAAVALPLDGAALFFNPGSVSFLKENSVSIGVSPVISRAEFTDQSSSVISKTNSPVSYPFTGYLVLGKKESRLKYGLAIYTPFGSTIDWENGWTGRFVLTHLKLQTIYFQPSVSFRINDKLGIGAGFVYGVSSLNLQSDMPMADGNGGYSKIELNGKAHGFGFNAGMYFKPIEKLSFGLSYRSQVNLTFDNADATFTVPSSMSSSFPSGPFSTKLPMPQVITSGVAYKATSKLTLAAEVTMVGWKAYDTLTYDFENNTAALSDMKFSRNYKNSYSYRLGGSYKLTSSLEARGGIKYLSTPVQSGYVTPEVPDASHFSYSAGLGYHFSSRFSADASFTFEQMKRFDSNYESSLTGTYHTRIFIPGIAVNYRF